MVRRARAHSSPARGLTPPLAHVAERARHRPAAAASGVMRRAPADVTGRRREARPKGTKCLPPLLRRRIRGASGSLD